MTEWLVAKGKEETLKFAYKYITKTISDWIVGIRKEKQDNFITINIKDSKAQFILAKPDTYFRELFVELTNKEIIVTGLSDCIPFKCRLDIFSFGYYGGYVLPHVAYENLKDLFEDGEFRIEKADTNDSAFFSDKQLADLWIKLDGIFDSDEWVDNFERGK